jgi:DNA-binding transcriptional LysR family regulator
LPWARTRSIDARLLFHDPIHLLAPPPWTPPPGRAFWSTLAAAPWVMEPRGNAARRWAVAMCREAGFEPNVRYESSDLLVHITMVDSGLAVAVLPQLVWRGAQQPLDPIELPGRPSRRIFTAVRAGSARSPAIRALRRSIRSAVGTNGARSSQRHH